MRLPLTLFLKTFFLLATALTIQLMGTQIADAAIRTWDGGGNDTNWNTCANWSTDACPTASDTPTFDATSAKDVSINTTVSVAAFDIKSTYAGAITQVGSNTLTVAGLFSQAGGTFNGGDGNITISTSGGAGDFILSGGTFTSTTGTLGISNEFTQTAGTFNHNNGTVALETPWSSMEPSLSLKGEFKQGPSRPTEGSLAPVVLTEEPRC